MKIISISGLDGSGKSTQIQLLKKHYENAGKKVFYFHAVQFSVANLLNRGKKEKSTNTTDVTKASCSAIQLRKIALFIDIIRFKILVRKLEKSYDYLLTDRYFYDMIVNINYLSRKNYIPPFFGWILQPDEAFFLNVSPESIMNRDNPPKQGMKYLKDKNALFHQYLKKFALTIIDGSRVQKKVCEDIMSKITL